MEWAADEVSIGSAGAAAMADGLGYPEDQFVCRSGPYGFQTQQQDGTGEGCKRSMRKRVGLWQKLLKVAAAAGTRMFHFCHVVHMVCSEVLTWCVSAVAEQLTAAVQPVINVLEWHVMPCLHPSSRLYSRARHPGVQVSTPCLLSSLQHTARAVDVEFIDVFYYM